MRFRVVYQRPADLVRDHAEQFARGGLWLPVAAAPALELFSQVELELVCPDGDSVVVTAQVIQQAAGAGVALGFTTVPELEQAVAAARSAGDAAGNPPSYEVVSDQELAGPDPEPVPEHVPADVHSRVRAASPHEKMQIALRGNRDERAVILRDPTARPVHAYLLRNPQIGVDEVAAIAAMRTSSADLLKQIADRREWAQRPEIASALVRNPKTPVPMAIKMVPWVALAELRQLAKASSLRAPILREIRKRILG